MTQPGRLVCKYLRQHLKNEDQNILKVGKKSKKPVALVCKSKLVFRKNSARKKWFFYKTHDLNKRAFIWKNCVQCLKNINLQIFSLDIPKVDRGAQAKYLWIWVTFTFYIHLASVDWIKYLRRSNSSIFKKNPISIYLLIATYIYFIEWMT